MGLVFVGMRLLVFVGTGLVWARIIVGQLLLGPSNSWTLLRPGWLLLSLSDALCYLLLKLLL